MFNDCIKSLFLLLWKFFRFYALLLFLFNSDKLSFYQSLKFTLKLTHIPNQGVHVKLVVDFDKNSIKNDLNSYGFDLP